METEYCDEPDLKHVAVSDRDLVEQYFVTECLRAMVLDPDNFDSETWREDFIRHLTLLAESQGRIEELEKVCLLIGSIFYPATLLLRQ